MTPASILLSVCRTNTSVTLCQLPRCIARCSSLSSIVSAPHWSFATRSLGTAISSPNMIQKADTMSALACKPSNRPLLERRSSAYPVSSAAVRLCVSERTKNGVSEPSVSAIKSISKKAFQLNGDGMSPCPLPTRAMKHGVFAGSSVEKPLTPCSRSIRRVSGVDTIVCPPSSRSTR